MLSPGYYATTLEHVTGAQQLLDKAQSLNVEDTEIKSALDTLQQDIDRMSKRRFAGNWKAAAIAAGIGFLMLNGRETANMGLFVLVGSALYIGSAFIPQYIEDCPGW